MTIKFHYLNRPIINYQQARLILKKTERKQIMTSEMKEKLSILSLLAFKDNKCE